VAADVPAGARRAAQDYLDYAVAKNRSEPGFLLNIFRSEEWSVVGVRLGEPYQMFTLTQEGLQLFAASEDADLLEFAYVSGYGFPVIGGDKIIGAITSVQASEGMKSLPDTTVAASLARNDGWIWNELLRENNPVLGAIGKYRAQQTAGHADADVAVLSVTGQGAFLLVVRGDRIEQIASTAKWSPMFIGVGKEGEAPPFVFTDYAAAEPIMRSNARKELESKEQQ